VSKFNREWSGADKEIWGVEINRKSQIFYQAHTIGQWTSRTKATGPLATDTRLSTGCGRGGSRRQALIGGGGGGLRVCMYRIRLVTEMYWSGDKVFQIFVVLGRNAIVQRT